MAKPTPAARRTERLAMLEQKLLDESTLGDIARIAAREKGRAMRRSEEHTSELQSLMRISYAVFCLKKKNLKAKRISKHSMYHTILPLSKYTPSQLNECQL